MNKTWEYFYATYPYFMLFKLCKETGERLVIQPTNEQNTEYAQTAEVKGFKFAGHKDFMDKIAWGSKTITIQSQAQKKQKEKIKLATN